MSEAPLSREEMLANRASLRRDVLEAYARLGMVPSRGSFHAKGAGRAKCCCPFTALALAHMPGADSAEPGALIAWGRLRLGWHYLPGVLRGIDGVLPPGPGEPHLGDDDPGTASKEAHEAGCKEYREGYEAGTALARELFPIRLPPTERPAEIDAILAVVKSGRMW